jgi:hypothetical protein
MEIYHTRQFYARKNQQVAVPMAQLPLAFDHHAQPDHAPPDYRAYLGA